MPVLNFFISITYSVLSCKLASNFFTFSIFILSGKNGRSIWSSCNFSVYCTSTSRINPTSLSSLYFLIKASLNWEASSIHSKNFPHYPTA